MTLVYFDLETGGLTPDHPNIQLAAAAVNDSGVIVAEFERKIQFDAGLADPEALKLNSFDAEVWARDGVPEGVAVNDFGAFLKRFAEVEMVSKRTGRPYNVARLAGYNAATFDGPRLHAMFQRSGAFLPAHPQVMCVLNLALWAFHGKTARPRSMKLGDVCSFFGVELDAHDALHDVKGTIALVNKLRSAAGLAV